LFDRFILTNAHVIGEFDPFSRKLSKTFTTVFGYEDLEAKETKCVPVKEHVAAYLNGKINMDRHLDFALLELKDVDEIADHPGLLSRNIPASPPNRSGICIVGHPIHDNHIIYSSCFFHGSSGSPVLDEDCYLIGVHTGGYAYKGKM
ncbi:hypothetical protein cypCar_00024297, partial [Cyprinus carpio]